MQLTGHAWFPTNSQRTFLPSGPPTTFTVGFRTSLSFGEAPAAEAQGPRRAPGRAQPTTLMGETLSPGFTLRWEFPKGRHFPFEPSYVFLHSASS